VRISIHTKIMDSLFGTMQQDRDIDELAALELGRVMRRTKKHPA
jgi:hypothetical protein